MKKALFILSMMIFFACSAGHHIVTMQEFSDVSVGMTEKTLIDQLGKPYSVKKISPNEFEYEYIEKISIEDRVIEERHYFVKLQNGKVVSKRWETVSPPPVFRRNAYDLQTSFN